MPARPRRGTPVPSGESLDEAGVGARRRGWRPALAIAAAALVAFAAGALLTGGDDDGRSREPIADIELAPTELGAGAQRRRARSPMPVPDTRSTSTSPGCRRRPRASTTRAGCTTRRRGDWVSVGTFHMRGGDGRVVLWAGVPIARYRELVVTAEVEGLRRRPWRDPSGGPAR